MPAESRLPDLRNSGRLTAQPAAGRFADDVHVFPIRVYYEDTDASGVVYHANYLRFAERARTEMWCTLGMQQSQLAAEAGILFVIRRCFADFLAPARLDDRLEVASRLTDLRGASIDLQQEVRRDGTDLVRLEVRLACITTQGRAARLPAAVRQAFAPLCRATGAPGAI
jgi:acyl-CoA thioester hydrolase